MNIESLTCKLGSNAVREYSIADYASTTSVSQNMFDDDSCTISGTRSNPTTVVYFTNIETAMSLGIPPTVNCLGRNRQYPPSIRCSVCDVYPVWGFPIGLRQPEKMLVTSSSCSSILDWSCMWLSQECKPFVDHVLCRHKNLVLPFLCKYCNHQFSNPKEYFLHSYRFLSEGFLCLLCEYPFHKRFDTIKYHLKKQHPSIDAEKLLAELAKQVRKSEAAAGRTERSEYLAEWTEGSSGSLVQCNASGNTGNVSGSNKCGIHSEDSNIVMFKSESQAAELGVCSRRFCDDSPVNSLRCGLCPSVPTFSFYLARWDNDLTKTLEVYWDHAAEFHAALPHPFQCFSCGKLFSGRTEFVQHTFKFPSNGFCCVHCGLTKSNRTLFRYHQCGPRSSTTANVDVDDDSIMCYEAKNKLNKAETGQQSGVAKCPTTTKRKNFPCSDCDKCYSTYQGFQYHFYTCHCVHANAKPVRISRTFARKRKACANAVLSGLKRCAQVKSISPTKFNSRLTSPMMPSSGKLPSSGNSSGVSPAPRASQMHYPLQHADSKSQIKLDQMAVLDTSVGSTPVATINNDITVSIVDDTTTQSSFPKMECLDLPSSVSSDNCDKYGKASSPTALSVTDSTSTSPITIPTGSSIPTDLPDVVGMTTVSGSCDLDPLVKIKTEPLDDEFPGEMMDETTCELATAQLLIDCQSVKDELKVEL